MARVISTRNRQTGCRNVTCRVVKSVLLCLLDSDSSKGFGKGGSEGLSDKKLTWRYSTRRQFSLQIRLNTYLLY